jgi:alpha-ketoglutarate-dependent taurine dioxygenase
MLTASIQREKEMLATLPDSAKLNVPPGLSGELLKRACALPNYENQEFYSTELQEHVYQYVRDVSLEDFDWLISEVKSRIARWPYCVLVRGLRFDEGNRLFVAVNRAFGELMARPYEKPRAQLVHYIQPATDLPSARGGHESERLHTDTADWKDPVEMISMVCVRADPNGGGRSRVLDVGSIREEVAKQLGEQTLELLETTPVPWQLAPYWGGGVNWRTVLDESHVCWRRYTINLALESHGLELSTEMSTALDAFEEVLASTTRTVEFLMREGELLLSDNIRTIHARTPIADGTASNRLMIRSWVRTLKGNNGDAGRSAI